MKESKNVLLWRGRLDEKPDFGNNAKVGDELFIEVKDEVKSIYLVTKEASSTDRPEDSKAVVPEYLKGFTKRPDNSTDDVRGMIVRLTSEMLDHPDQNDIYPTTKFYNDLETAISRLITEAVIAELELWDAAEKAGATHRSSKAQRIAQLKSEIKVFNSKEV